MRIALGGHITTRPHVLRLGDPVRQRMNAWQHGYITRVERGANFTVTYVDEDRKPREPRTRHTYPWVRMGDFLLGHEQEYESAPIPVHTEAFR